MVKVKIFDEEHERDLEEKVNHFLQELSDNQLVDIKYQVAMTKEIEDEQIYCYSAMIIYHC